MIAYLVVAAVLALVWCLVLALPAGRAALTSWWQRASEAPETDIRAELGSPVGALVYLSALAVIGGVVLSAAWLLDAANAATPY